MGKLVKTTDASPPRGYSAVMSEQEKWIEETRAAIEEGIRTLTEEGPSLARYREALMTTSQRKSVDHPCVSRRISSTNMS